MQELINQLSANGEDEEAAMAGIEQYLSNQ